VVFGYAPGKQGRRQISVIPVADPSSTPAGDQ
jgi:hypothetical protein